MLMRNVILKMMVLVGIGLGSSAMGAVQTYEIDNGHSAVMFKAHHFGAGYTWGRFTETSGTFTVAPQNIEKSNVSFTVNAQSVETHDKKRDEHLRGPDFLNAKEHSKISFNSTSIKAAGGNKFKVNGKLKVNGVSRDVSLMATKTGEGKDPWGNQRYGIDLEHELSLKDYKVKGVGGVGDKIRLFVSIEGILKKKKK